MLWYNRKINPLFRSYVETQSIFHNINHPIDRCIFVCKCLGYLDCLFNRNVGIKFKEYTFIKNKLLNMLNSNYSKQYFMGRKINDTKQQRKKRSNRKTKK